MRLKDWGFRLFFRLVRVVFIIFEFKFFSTQIKIFILIVFHLQWYIKKNESKIIWVQKTFMFASRTRNYAHEFNKKKKR